MFSKILIANRGEIACRVMRTARRMGIKTVAVYSEADADAMHVELADEAVPVGPAPSNQSYLVAARILDAARQTGAEAIHPGYGFLSENKAFAAAVEEAGIAFIGPRPDAIAAMGDKIESKRLAQEAGVNSVPGRLSPLKDADEAVAVSEEIGFPVMLKASAGGGGKGMRIAFNAEEAREGFRSATNEAKSSFGDDRVFVEKFVDQPRHIEIQVLADGHGNVVHLGERECSVQRRHQKVLEEAPSPFLDPETRAAMGAQAVALSKAVNYRSAGTVEFIVDSAKNFYFLEMNTRLQVEHPVTEKITGLDLVELMIRIADGERLPFTQDDIRLDGWALEARVYAEDPVRNFLPSIGRLNRYVEPLDDPADPGSVRVDSGVTEGSEITMFYDPMIAKLVTYAPDRAAAINRMLDALDGYVIRGVGHNAAFLSAALDLPRFREGRLTTGFIAEEFPDGFMPREPDDETARIFAVVAAMAQYRLGLGDSTLGEADTGPLPKRGGMIVPRDWVVRMGERSLGVKLDGSLDALDARVEERMLPVRGTWRPGMPLFRGRVGAQDVVVQIARDGLRWHLSYRGMSVDAQVLSPRAAELARHMPVKVPPDTSKLLLSPMPGLLVSLAVGPGDQVKAGQELAVVEAMKMENILRADSDGVIAKLRADPGDSLAVDQAILEFE